MLLRMFQIYPTQRIWFNFFYKQIKTRDHVIMEFGFTVVVYLKKSIFVKYIMYLKTGRPIAEKTVKIGTSNNNAPLVAPTDSLIVYPPAKSFPQLKWGWMLPPEKRFSPLTWESSKICIIQQKNSDEYLASKT